MKTLFLVTIFLTLPAIVSAREVPLFDLVKRNDLYYEKFSNVPFTGETIVGKSKIKIVGPATFLHWRLKDGKRHGPQESYYENGQLRSTSNYKDGKVHGSWQGYYENGNLEIKKTYKDGKAHGLTESYYENGQLEEKSNYKDGKLISRTCFSESGEQVSC